MATFAQRSRYSLIQDSTCRIGQRRHAAAGTAFATPHGPIDPATGLPTPSSNPTTGHKAGPTNTCPGTSGTPGKAGSANGSPFNPDGTAGGVYAGNPGTASLANSNSSVPFPSTIGLAFKHPDLVATGTGELEQKLELPQLSVNIRSNGAWACVDVMDPVN